MIADSIESICEILQLPSYERTKSDLNKLKSCLVSNAFIRQESKKLQADPDTLDLLFKSLKYEDAAKN